MAPISIDPTLNPSDVHSAIHIHNPTDTNSLTHGDVVESWDFTFKWDEHCRTADELEKWRSIPDPLVDAYLATLPPNLLSPSSDQLSLLLAQAASRENPEAEALVRHLTSEPPEGVKADAETMKKAMGFFYEFAGGLLLGTFYISLVGGFSSPRITKVLHQTSYLVAPIRKSPVPVDAHSPAAPASLPTASPSSSGPHDSTSQQTAHTPYNPSDETLLSKAYEPITAKVKERTSIRLLETLQFVLDIMGSPLAPSTPSEQKFPTEEKPSLLPRESTRIGPGTMTPLTGEGWRSTVRVRLLHGVVRHRVMASMGKGKEGGYDFDTDGYPLNAEDMTLTLASFCVAPIWACERIGSPVDEQGKLAFIAHWRHVGYYLGIPEEILERHFQVPIREGKVVHQGGMNVPNKIFASLITHLFAHPKDLEDTAQLPPPSLPLLHTAADMPPFITPLKKHFRAARFFLGDALATALNIPRSSYRDQIRLGLYFNGVTFPEKFGKYYPRRGWNEKRKVLTQDLLGRMVRWKLDGRRTQFRAHEVESGSKTKQEGDLPSNIAQLEKDGIDADTSGAKKAYYGYQALMIEMGVVSLTVAGLSVWMGYKALGFLIRGGSWHRM